MAGALTAEHAPVKQRAALLSVASNSLLILLKVIAGAVTGSVALLAEAMQSTIDLVASLVAYVSVRKADAPADEDHPYGHEKFENLAAAIEGLLILVGSGVIVFEAVRRLIGDGGELESLGFGIVVIAITIVVNLAVATVLARRARETQSPALEGDAAHLRTDALTSVGVLAGLVLVEVTGAEWIDPVVALSVAAAIVVTGARLVRRAGGALVDETLPGHELEMVREQIIAFGPRAGAPCGRASPRRHARAVPRRDDARGGARDCPRAAGGDQHAARRGRRAHPPRARGSGAAWDGDPSRRVVNASAPGRAARFTWRSPTASTRRSRPRLRSCSPRRRRSAGRIAAVRAATSPPTTRTSNGGATRWTGCSNGG
jgi:cation diffusion facilitator family transporter